MKDDKKNEATQWNRELSAFLSVESVTPSKVLSDKIKKTVFEALHPSPLFVFAKLVVSALIASASTLFICPQFGVGMKGHGLMHVFMSISPLLCQFACGVLFLTVGVFAATFILTTDEVRVLYRTKHLQITALTGATLGLFACFGSVGFFLAEWAWIVGGVVGGTSAVYVGAALRERLT